MLYDVQIIFRLPLRSWDSIPKPHTPTINKYLGPYSRLEDKIESEYSLSAQ